jgi:hypothetical protein
MRFTHAGPSAIIKQTDISQNFVVQDSGLFSTYLQGCDYNVNIKGEKEAGCGGGQKGNR